MTVDVALANAPPQPRDRELIRVDLSHDAMGIAAALRRAFAAAAQDHSDHDFERLLSELN